ncbi:MAG TPA: hypothetical protein VHB48_14535 [Chitinophagaceae bacterium]|nr:hypothetical protein [Chitinophagaceae bacterium]
MKTNKLVLGLALGFIMPLLGVLVFYLWKAGSASLPDFIQVAFQNKSFLTAIISFSLFLNAIVFTYYVNKRLDKTAVGIFIATCIYALPAIIIKLTMH